MFGKTHFIPRSLDLVLYQNSSKEVLRSLLSSLWPVGTPFGVEFVVGKGRGPEENKGSGSQYSSSG